MNEIYDFSWLISEIDKSLILKLVIGDGDSEVYQVSEVGYDYDKIEVKFAVVGDLIKFINHCGIVFRDINNADNIIRIPLRKLFLLYSNSNILGDDNNKYISGDSLEAFVMRDGKILKEDYQIYSFKINEESDELRSVMEIAYNFNDMGMQETIDALGKINLVNYHKSSNSKSS